MFTHRIDNNAFLRLARKYRWMYGLRWQLSNGRNARIKLVEVSTNKKKFVKNKLRQEYITSISRKVLEMQLRLY
jgi:hypothetical protein